MKRIKTSGNVPQYHTSADFYVADDMDGRWLIVKYRDKPAPSRDKFTAAIPYSWTDEDVRTLIDANAYFSYPLWEIVAQAFGDQSLAQLRPLLDAVRHLHEQKIRQGSLAKPADDPLRPSAAN